MNIGTAVEFLKKITKPKDCLNVYDCITPIYYISRIFNLWPYKINKNGDITPLTPVRKGWTILFNAGVILLFTWTLQKRNKGLLFHGEASATTVTDWIYSFSSHLFVTFCVYTATATHYEPTKRFFSQIDEIDGMYFCDMSYVKIRKKLINRARLFLGFSVALKSFDFVFFGLVNGFKTVLCSYSTYYYVEIIYIIVFLQMYYKVEILREHFKILNRELQRSSTAIEIRRISRAHAKLANLIAIFNELHGMQLLLLFFSIVSMALYGLSFIIYDGNFVESSLLNAIITFYMLSLSGYNLITFVVLIKNCAATSEEAKKSKELANDLLLQIDVEVPDFATKLFKNELQLLQQQTECRNLRFSAAGFFFMGFPVITAIADTVTAYFIVILQFNSAD